MRGAGAASARGSARFLRVFWERAYRENITGLSAMVAYNLALALFPFALLVLFIFGQTAGETLPDDGTTNRPGPLAVGLVLYLEKVRS